MFAKDVRARQRDELISLLGRGIEDEEEQKFGSDQKRPVLAKYISGSIKLRARIKGKVIKASARKDGLIRYGGKAYTSPSLAAAKACKRPTCNGWTFWTYERAPGDWVSLNELRK
jgi:hypothetical protein